MIGHMRHGSPPRLLALQSILSPNPRESLPTPSAGVRIRDFDGSGPQSYFELNSSSRRDCAGVGMAGRLGRALLTAAMAAGLAACQETRPKLSAGSGVSAAS